MNELRVTLVDVLKRDAAVNNLVEQLVGRLAEDEGWQGNLTDDERKAALDWARAQLRAQLRSQVSGWLTAMRGRLRTLGALMNSDCIERAAVLQAWLE
jgi:predicted DNA-binding ribbon-helix-helix protein